MRSARPRAQAWRRLDCPSADRRKRSEEHTSELQSRENLVCRLLLEKKNNGNPVQTPQGLTDTVVPWKNLGGPPDYLFSASSAEYVPIAYQAQKEHFAVTLTNPTLGL